MKKCKYHCDYGDGENCHYEGQNGCMFNRMDYEIAKMPTLTELGYVQVIRCNDCQKWTEANKYSEIGDCSRFNCCTRFDFFCADGKLKQRSKMGLIEDTDATVLDIKDICHRTEFCEFRWGIPANYEPINAILRWLNNPKYIYGKTWRCWSKRPSKEQMENTRWSERMN